MTTTKKNQWFPVTCASIVLAAMLALCFASISHIAQHFDNRISKVSDEHAHCYTHRSAISCVPGTADPAPTSAKEVRI